MVSVTNFIKKTKQPYFGFLPLSDFNHRVYDHRVSNDIVFSKKLIGIKGMVVDYMVRFSLKVRKKDAFRVSLEGARLVGDYRYACGLLNSIIGLDDDSISSACLLVQYDVAYRRGVEYYNSNFRNNLTAIDFNEIRVLIERTLAFFKDSDQMIQQSGITFEGGYSDIITSGDADFISQNTLWDLKTGNDRPSSKDTLQLFVYYLLGVKSKNEYFDNIDSLGVYNPRRNESYTIQISEIPLRIGLWVFSLIYGLSFDAYDFERDMKNNPENFEFLKNKYFTKFNWDAFNGKTHKDYFDAMRQDRFSNKESKFNPINYDDGIHKISKFDYASYCHNSFDAITESTYSRTNQIYFLKKASGFMFISENHNGQLCLMNAGHLKKLDNNLDYYFNNLDCYVNMMNRMFLPQYEYMVKLANELTSIPIDNSLQPEWLRNSYIDDQKKFNGRIHGLIIDLDYFNHIFVNFRDKIIVPYAAKSIVNKNVYPTIHDLLIDARPDMADGYNGFLLNHKESLLSLIDSGSDFKLISTIDTDGVEVVLRDHIELKYDGSTEMYSLSNVYKKIQRLFTHKHVVIWVDMPLDEIPLNNRTLEKDT